MRWLGLINVKPNTLKDYRYSVRRFIVPFFGDIDIRKLRYSDIVEFQKSINRCEKGKYNVLSCLKTMMRWAWRNEDIAKVPPFPRVTQGQLPPVAYISFEQQEKALQAIVARHRPIFQIGMEFGLRIGEMRALQWDCITEDKIIIKRAFAENQLMETTKTGQIRESMITPYVREVITSLSMTSSTFVFVREDGKPYTDKNLNAIWKAACLEAEIEPIKLYNAVRHSLGCQMLDMGIEFDIVQNQLGHTDPRMTRRYATRSQVKMMEALIKRRATVVPFREVKNGQD
jgi:integrase